MKNNVIQKKSFDFAIKIIETCKILIYDKKEYTLSKQLLRSGTSIGANIEESIGGQSHKDFIHKISISYKEARETMYWLKLLRETKFITSSDADLLINDAEEICRILGKIKKTYQENQMST
jgi:four helix bundle protein